MFFYIRNADPAVNVINLPPFFDAPPLEKTNWGYCPKKPSKEMEKICGRVGELTKNEGLKPADLIAAFIARRVLPLQRQEHRICDMSGRHDPTRMSTKELSPVGIVHRVNYISKAGLKEGEWRFGKEPYHRENPAPAVSPWSLYFAASTLFLHPDATGWP